MTDRLRSCREPTLPAARSPCFTECARSCLEPTLFLGSATAAYETPPSAMKTAIEAITLANVSRPLIEPSIRPPREASITHSSPER